MLVIAIVLGGSLIGLVTSGSSPTFRMVVGGGMVVMEIGEMEERERMLFRLVTAGLVVNDEMTGLGTRTGIGTGTGIGIEIEMAVVTEIGTGVETATDAEEIATGTTGTGDAPGQAVRADGITIAMITGTGGSDPRPESGTGMKVINAGEWTPSRVLIADQYFICARFRYEHV